MDTNLPTGTINGSPIDPIMLGVVPVDNMLDNMPSNTLPTDGLPNITLTTEEMPIAAVEETPRQSFLDQLWHTYLTDTKFAIYITLVLMVIIAAIPVAIERVQYHQKLQAAMLNPIRITGFQVMVVNYPSVTGTVRKAAADNGDSLLVEFGSPAQPYVYNLGILRYYGTSVEGDKLSFFWNDQKISTTCPAFWAQGNAYLHVCGLRNVRIP